jgi:hypothetical protein
MPMDTRFADVSEFQRKPVDSSYPLPLVSFRSNDGDYADHLFTDNWHYVMSRSGRQNLRGFIVYFVWRPNWKATTEVFKARIGEQHHKRMAVMIDVERWNGQITGDHSADISATREGLIAWLHGNRPKWQKSILLRRYFRAQDRKRVLIYANQFDLAVIDPHHGDAPLIIADYDPVRLHFPGMVAQQYTSKGSCAPWGSPVDMNVARGYSARGLCRRLGLGTLRWSP